MEVTFIDMYGYICSNKSKLIKNKMCVCVCVWGEGVCVRAALNLPRYADT